MLINDPIHGLLRLTDLQRQLIALPELARLSWIKQLGLSFQSFPGGTHSRLCHVIGASHVAGEMARALGLPDKETTLLQAAGMLHDVGHTPFSHALETLLPGDHMHYTRDLVTGAAVMKLPGAGQLPRVLERHGVDPVQVGALIEGKHRERVLQSIIFGDVDCDQLDYLLRDSYFCGISHGKIDHYRILYTLKVDRDRQEVVIEEKGVDAIEEMLVARDHMYSAVYGHKTGRIGEMMLLRAMQLAERPVEGFQEMTDHEVLTRLEDAGELSRVLIRRVIFRDLYKSAFRVDSAGRDDMASRVMRLVEKKSARELETEIIRGAGLGAGDVIVDLPVNVFKLSEPRLKSFNLRVLRKTGETVPLLSLSALARALTQKESTHTIFATYCDTSHRERVAAVCEKLMA
ncbi:MAG: HD domain-containing protein [Candidatus Wallbacteria bacterium]|nr:HD domain-containing protein [Candidatus Wallbacteria bacterium]